MGLYQNHRLSATGKPLSAPVVVPEVGVAVAAGIAVAVGLGVAVDVGLGVAVAVAVAVAVGLGMGVAVDVGPVGAESLPSRVGSVTGTRPRACRPARM